MFHLFKSGLACVPANVLGWGIRRYPFRVFFFCFFELLHHGIKLIVCDLRRVQVIIEMAVMHDLFL